MKRPPLEERRAMHDIIASDSFDKAKAEAQIDKMAEQHKARMLAHLETQNKIYNILTPEQKKQFNANFEKRLTERPAMEGKMPAQPNNRFTLLRPPGSCPQKRNRCGQDRRFSFLPSCLPPPARYAPVVASENVCRVMALEFLLTFR
jgi:hypothetical protein